MHAGEVGVPRLLKLFKKHNMTTTWFIPGHSLETFPKEMAAVRDAGHEIGLHGYSHENVSRFRETSDGGKCTSSSRLITHTFTSNQPREMTIEQQRDVLAKTHKLLTDFCGKPPRGSVAPWWETSAEGTNLLLDWGIEYDHSSQAHDSQMFYLRDEDHWTKIGGSIQVKCGSKLSPVAGLLENRLHSEGRDLDEAPCTRQ